MQGEGVFDTEFERMSKEVILFYFKVPSKNSPRVTE